MSNLNLNLPKTEAEVKKKKLTAMFLTITIMLASSVFIVKFLPNLLSGSSVSTILFTYLVVGLIVVVLASFWGIRWGLLWSLSMPEDIKRYATLIAEHNELLEYDKTLERLPIKAELRAFEEYAAEQVIHLARQDLQQKR